MTNELDNPGMPMDAVAYQFNEIADSELHSVKGVELRGAEYEQS
jgi:hypothetical protein